MADGWATSSWRPPVVHLWFLKVIGILLDMPPAHLEEIVYLQRYVVLNPGHTPLKECEELTAEEFHAARESYGDGFAAGIGAQAVKTLLERLNLVDLARELRAQLDRYSPAQKAWQISWRNPYPASLLRRLETVEALRDSGNRAEWMVLECIPVIPPDLRPLAEQVRGHSAGNDLHVLYRNVIRRSNGLKKLATLNPPEVVLHNEKRMLQEAVDALFDNRRCRRPLCGDRGRRPLTSLSDLVEAKKGPFRKNLLGKRVDYSARSVVVPGPNLKPHQCGLPKTIALELFRPFVLWQLVELGHADNIDLARLILERQAAPVWDVPTGGGLQPLRADQPPAVAESRCDPGIRAGASGRPGHSHPPAGLPKPWRGFRRRPGRGTPPSFRRRPGRGRRADDARQQSLQSGQRPSGPQAVGGRRDGLLLSHPGAAALQRRGDRVRLARRGAAGLVVGRRRDPRCDQAPAAPGRSLQGRPEIAPGSIIDTTVGRVAFNALLPLGMPYYNRALRSVDLDEVLSDCCESCGRRSTIDLLENVYQLGCRAATRSGLSLATDDLMPAPNKQKILAEAEKAVVRTEKVYARSLITDGERYNVVLDVWTHAREKIAAETLSNLENDRRFPSCFNPLFLMFDSGACDGLHEMRSLAGITGLKAKASGKIIETPVKTNFREGLTVLEYFSALYGARKGLTVTASKTADSAYLTRKLAGAVGDIVVTMPDCGTRDGVTKGAVCRGERVLMGLADSIEGRVSRARLVDPISGEEIVGENEMITRQQSQRIEGLGIDKFRVRSPLTCQAPHGVCRLCYGRDVASGALVEEGAAVGMIAAQSVGKFGTNPWGEGILPWNRWPLPICATSPSSDYEDQVRAQSHGRVRLNRIAVVRNDAGQNIVRNRNGEILVVDDKGRELEKYLVPPGANLSVANNEEVSIGQVLCQWDLRTVPVLAEQGGKVRFDDFVEGETVCQCRDQVNGAVRWGIVEHAGDAHPRILIEDERGRVLAAHYLHETAILEVRDGQTVSAGALLARTPRRYAGTTVMADHHWLVEILEARRPCYPATLAEIGGIVKLGEKRPGRPHVIYVRNQDGLECRHRIPPGKHLRVCDGTCVKAGEYLDYGIPSPHDLLRILGASALEQHLLDQLQSIYRSCYVAIDDKHLEIIVSQMLRRVRVQMRGDTQFLPGKVMDGFSFQAANDRLRASVKIVDPGDSPFEPGQIIGQQVFAEERTRAEAEGKIPPTWIRPKVATAATALLGITQLAARPASFIAAAEIREMTKVLTAAALAGKIDHLAGRKENVILGRLLPAGMGFRKSGPTEE